MFVIEPAFAETCVVALCLCSSSLWLEAVEEIAQSDGVWVREGNRYLALQGTISIGMTAFNPEGTYGLQPGIPRG